MASHLTRRKLLLAGGASVLLAGGTAAGVAALTDDRTVESDLIVFGATAAGVVAAVQARRMGRRSVIIEEGHHVGGMITSGLGNSDLGTKQSIGGITAEFFRRIHAKYEGTVVTDKSPARYTFEPHVAQEVLTEMLDAAQVPLYTGAKLRNVQRRGARIVALETQDGSAFYGRVFVDASYEGDLMDRAGVDWTVGRESNSAFGETYNGVRLSIEKQHTLFVSPYRKEGVASSGLLPGVVGSVGPNGSADPSIQAYNFRMCLTRSPDRIPFPKPADYDPIDYELLRRMVKGGYSGDFFNAYEVGGGKVDANASGPFSTDYIGANHAYPTAGRGERAAIIAEHARFQQGLMWFLANDPGIPYWLRERTGQWGLAPDEFRETGGWPPQLYIREARRMRSAYIMTEHDCFGSAKAADSIGLASYFMDLHSCQRVAHLDGVVNEGSVTVTVPRPFPISYRSIVPVAARCTNLLVPVCLSATHTAYGPIRMEPVFMILAQSAATAAVMAVDADIDVQKVDYTSLAARLRADHQILSWPEQKTSIIMDNRGPGVRRTGRWVGSDSVTGFYGADYERDDPSTKGGTSMIFTPTLPGPGQYAVHLRWTGRSDRASNVPVDIVHMGMTTSVSVNQRKSGGKWVSVGSFAFAADGTESVILRADGTDGYVIADAVRFTEG